MRVVDNRGLSCPQPVINTKKALDELSVGSIISIVDNAVARENVLKFAKSQGCTAESRDDNGVFYITISRGEAEATPEHDTVVVTTSSSTTLYLVTTDEFGKGSAELGHALMKTFMYALSESGTKNNHLIFVNAGAQLTCLESPILESLRKLSAAGWQIKTCGTCLDFYGIKDKLAIGEITNMYTIVELMAEAGKVVTL